MKNKIPQSLQPFLWSAKIKDLDLKRDKVFIVNQILAFGGLKELKWLFNIYPKTTIKQIFLNHPIKTYRVATFNFIKEIILELESKKLTKEKYVINIPRVIR